MSKTDSKKNKTDSKNTKTKKKAEPKIFCGITDPIPKGYRLGSMKECLDKNQVRYYGLKKIDSKLIEQSNIKVEVETETTLQVKAAGLKGKLTKIKRDMGKITDFEEKKKIMTEYDNVRNQLLLIGEKIRKMKL